MGKKSASKVQTPVRSNDIRSFFTKTPTSALKPKETDEKNVEIEDIKPDIKNVKDSECPKENIPVPPPSNEDAKENEEEKKQLRTKKIYIDRDICLIEEALDGEKSGTISIVDSDDDEEGTISGMSSEFDEDEFPFEDSSFDEGDYFGSGDSDNESEVEDAKIPKKKAKRIVESDDDDEIECGDISDIENEDVEMDDDEEGDESD